MHAIVSLVARILMAAIFINAGFAKMMNYAGTEGFMQQFGTPPVLLPAVIALEALGGLAILLGLWSRYAGLLLAFFTLAAAAIFHSNFSDPAQTTSFMKNVAMAGGLLLLFANGSGRYALKPD